MREYPLFNVVDMLKNAPGVKFWKPRKIYALRELVLHHAAGAEDQTVQQIHTYHQTKDWGSGPGVLHAPRIVYHYLVSPDGTQWKANFASWKTWHCADKHVSYNATAMSICLIGNRETHEAPFDQYMSAVQLAAKVCNEYNLRVDRVFGHGQLIPTKCPGRLINTDRFRADVAAAIGRGPM